MLFQRMPWGGGKRRGVENLTNDTPPKKGFWTPPPTVRFPPPSAVSALFFLYKNPRQSRPEALLEGSKNFRESAFSGTFSPPHTFCTPPYHRPIILASHYFLTPAQHISLAIFVSVKAAQLPNRQSGVPKIDFPEFSSLVGSKQKGPAEQMAPRVSSLKICRFWVCVFPIIPWRKYDSQIPLFGGDFLGQILAADSLPGAFVHSRTGGFVCGHSTDWRETSPLNIDILVGFSRDWAGDKKLFICFLSAHFLTGKEKHGNRITRKSRYNWKRKIRGPWPYAYQGFLQGISVMVIVLLLLRSRYSEDHDHMCSTSFERRSWSWSSSFSFLIIPENICLYFFCCSVGASLPNRTPWTSISCCPTRCRDFGGPDFPALGGKWSWYAGLHWYTIGNSRITFHHFILGEWFLAIISSWLTSKTSGRIISRNLSDLHLLPHLLRLTQSLHQKILGGN